MDALAAAGCDEILEERASGGNRARPVLARLLSRVAPGDTVVVTRLDRFARSLSHLLEIVETLDGKGAFFRSLQGPVDTAGPQGRLMIQMLGAFAEFERSLIRERTRAGIQAAKARGRVGGNPGLRARTPSAIRKVVAGRDRHYMAELTDTAEHWLPIVRSMRPGQPWLRVVEALNRTAPATPWTTPRLVRAVRRFIREGLAEASLLEPAPRKLVNLPILTLITAISRANPEMTLAGIGAQLRAMNQRTPRGMSTWSAGSVKQLVDRARRAGMLSG